MSKNFIKIFTCLLFLSLTIVYAQDKVFTLRQAIEQALQANPNFKVAKSQTDETYFTYKSVGALPNLLLNGNYTGGNNTIVSNNGQMQDVNLVLQQSFGPIGSVGYAGQAAYHGYEASRATLQQTQLTLIQNVKDSFYSLLSAQEQLRVTEENLQLANQLYSFVEKKFNAGASPRTDLVNAEIQKASAEQGKIQAEIAKKQAQNGFALVLGLSEANAIQATGSLELKPLTRDFAMLREMAEENHPTLIAAEKTLQQAKAQTNFAKSQRNPSPSLFYNYDLTTTPLYLFGASLQFPIFDYGQIRNDIKFQEKITEEKQHALDAAKITILTSLKTAYETYQAAYLNASTYKEKVIIPSLELMKMTRFGYNEGATPYMQVVLAEQNLRNVTTQYITLLLTAHQAMDSLEAAVGQPLQQ